MKIRFNILLFLLSVCCVVLTGISMRSVDQPPEAEITNGLVHVKLYLPDANTGYYRGTRFDWSGVIPELTYKGHSYHGQWFTAYNPTNHDAIMGPVEEFGPLGYAEAGTGRTFVKVGIGRVIKPDDRPYSPFRFYKIADGGKWKIKKKSNEVQFTHTLADDNYAYEYTKTVTLTKGKPELVLLHALKNKGKRRMEMTVYNHNFFVIDGEPTGPGYVVSLPVKNLSAAGGQGVGEYVKLEENRILYSRDLLRGEQAYFPDLAAGVPIPYDLSVENINTGAGVRIKGDRAISKMVYWSSSTTVSPEPYINVSVEPGKTFRWEISYSYYTKDEKK